MANDKRPGCTSLIGYVVVLAVVGSIAYIQYGNSRARDRCQEILAKPDQTPFDCRAWMASRPPNRVYEDGSADPTTLEDLMEPSCAVAAKHAQERAARERYSKQQCMADPNSGGS